MEEAWRWFGPDDAVTLDAVLQAGASSVASSLDHIPAGDVWPLEQITAHRDLIESNGLTWSVVESVPVHADIKSGAGSCARRVADFRETIRNLGAAGIRRVCYNFMPVVDWTRTALDFDMPSRSQALRFDMADFAAYDMFVLGRPDARKSYPDALVERAAERHQSMSGLERRTLEGNIIAGLPGGSGSYDRDGIARTIGGLSGLDAAQLRGNLVAFLEEITPAAEDSGVTLCIHPDDPPFPLFGLPRVVSTADDAHRIGGILVDDGPFRLDDHLFNFDVRGRQVHLQVGGQVG